MAWSSCSRASAVRARDPRTRKMNTMVAEGPPGTNDSASADLFLRYASLIQRRARFRSAALLTLRLTENPTRRVPACSGPIV